MKRMMRGLEISEESLSKLIGVLEKDIEKTEKRADDYIERWDLTLDFISESGLIKEFVEFIYENNKDGKDSGIKSADIVLYFHEMKMDLSTIECCKKDFKPWR